MENITFFALSAPIWVWILMFVLGGTAFLTGYRQRGETLSWRAFLLGFATIVLTVMFCRRAGHAGAAVLTYSGTVFCGYALLWIVDRVLHVVIRFRAKKRLSNHRYNYHVVGEADRI